MIERKEYLDWYATEFNRAGGYKITAKVGKGTPGLRRFSIYIDFENDSGVKYSYNINSPLGGDGAKELVEFLILNFNPDVIPPLKNPKPIIKEFEDGALFELEKKDNYGDRSIRVDGKRYSFIRAYNKFDFMDFLILNFEKKIKLSHIETKELIELGKKEWNNFNLYLPQFDKIYKKFDILQNVKLKAKSYAGYLKYYMAIESKIDEYTATIIKECFLSTESNNSGEDYSEEEKRLANDILKCLPGKIIDNSDRKILQDDIKQNNNHLLLLIIIIVVVLIFLFMLMN